eukprot:264062_1
MSKYVFYQYTFYFILINYFILCIQSLHERKKHVDAAAVNIEEEPEFWPTIWKGIGLVIAGLLLFGKTCMVLVGCWCCHVCCKYCKKEDNEIEDNDVELEVQHNRIWNLNGKYDKYIQWFIIGMWSFMLFVCVLGIVSGLIWMIVILIEDEYGYRLGPAIP